MNILYLAHRIPYPPNKGDKIRSFNQIKYLAQHGDLHLAFLVDDRDDLRHLGELERYCRQTAHAAISPRWQKLKSLPYLLTSQPLSVPYFYSAELQQSIDRILDHTEMDAVLCFSSPMAEYVFKSRHYRNGRLGNSRLIMDFVDVDSDKWRMYADFQPFPLSAVYRREWRRLADYEARVGKAFDWSVLVSEKEADLFATICPEARTAAIANGVDIDYFAAVQEQRSACPREGQEPTLLFMGAMDYFPNDDAALFFAREVLPLIRREIPAVKFYVVGGKPSERLQALGRADAGVVVTGFVPDVRPYLARADVFVAPLRIARGVQNKVLEAMAAGVPVVARPEAVQGLSLASAGLSVEESPERLAAAVTALLSDPAGAARCVEKATRMVESRYRWDDNMAALRQLIGAGLCSGGSDAGH